MLEAMTETHEGKLVLALLAEAGRSQADFARAYPSPKGGTLSTARASALVKVDRFKHATWERVRIALERLQIDPNRIRPATMQNRPRAIPEDLRPLLQHLKPEQQQIVLRILLADEGSREMLRVALEERLGRLQ